MACSLTKYLLSDIESCQWQRQSMSGTFTQCFIVLDSVLLTHTAGSKSQVILLACNAVKESNESGVFCNYEMCWISPISHKEGSFQRFIKTNSFRKTKVIKSVNPIYRLIIGRKMKPETIHSKPLKTSTWFLWSNCNQESLSPVDACSIKHIACKWAPVNQLTYVLSVCMVCGLRQFEFRFKTWQRVIERGFQIIRDLIWLMISTETW
jgi:hypothetical protein